MRAASVPTASLPDMRATGIRCAILVAAAMLGGCQASPAGVVSLSDEPLAREVRRQADSAYPAAFRCVHRTIITAGRRQYVLTGFLDVKRPDEVRLVATSEFGPTAFRASWVRGIGPKAAAFGGRAQLRMAAAAARDAYVIYLAAPDNAARLARLPDGRLTLSEKRPGGGVVEFEFDSGTHRVLAYREPTRRRNLYEARFSDFGPVGASGVVVPRRIDILDRAAKYSATIQVVDLDVAK